MVTAEPPAPADVWYWCDQVHTGPPLEWVPGRISELRPGPCARPHWWGRGDEMSITNQADLCPDCLDSMRQWLELLIDAKGRAKA